MASNKNQSYSEKNNKGKMFDDGFDENYIGDDADVEYLNSLTQLERERIIAKRHSKRERSMIKKNLFSIVTNDKGLDDKKVSGRPLTKEKKSRLGILTKEDHLQVESEKKNRNPGDNPSKIIEEEPSESESDSQSESPSEKISPERVRSVEDSDEDFIISSNENRKKTKKTKRIQKLKHRKPKPRETLPKERKSRQSPFRLKEQARADSLKIQAAKHFEFLNSICVKRDFLGKLCNRPYFDKTIKFCLVKVNFSTVRGNQYRIGIIRNVVQLPDEEYELNGKNYAKYLEVYFSAGEARNRVAMANVSNRPIDESEAFQLLVKLKDFPDVRLDLDWVESKKSGIREMLNFRMTSKEIDNLIQERLDGDQSVSLFEKRQLLEQRYNQLTFININNFQSKRLQKIQDLKRKIDCIKQQEAVENKKNRKRGVKLSKFLKYEQLNEKQRKKFKRNVSQPINLWAIKEEDLVKERNKPKDSKKGKSKKVKTDSKQNQIEIYRNYKKSIKEFKEIFSDVEKFRKVVSKWPMVDYSIQV